MLRFYFGENLRKKTAIFGNVKCNDDDAIFRLPAWPKQHTFPIERIDAACSRQTNDNRQMSRAPDLLASARRQRLF